MYKGDGVYITGNTHYSHQTIRVMRTNFSKFSHPYHKREVESLNFNYFSIDDRIDSVEDEYEISNRVFKIEDLPINDFPARTIYFASKLCLNRGFTQNELDFLGNTVYMNRFINLRESPGSDYQRTYDNKTYMTVKVEWDKDAKFPDYAMEEINKILEKERG